MDKLPWSRVNYDRLWLVTVPDWSVARQRLVQRHQEAGITATPEAALARAEENDRPNGELVLATLRPNVRKIQLVA
jgi:hypothetical protein